MIKVLKYEAYGILLSTAHKNQIFRRNITQECNYVHLTISCYINSRCERFVESLNKFVEYNYAIVITN